MNRFGLLAIVVGAGACDIVGHVPETEPSTVALVHVGCSGSNPRFDVSIKLDAALDDADELQILWDIGANFSSRVVFRPTLDCGWWSGGFRYQGIGSGSPPVSAYCAREGGPPRQIVTLSGAVILDGKHADDLVNALFSAQTENSGGGTLVQQSPNCQR